MLPKMKDLIKNPDSNDLRSFVAEMPNAELTECGNYNVNTKVTARSSESTFFVSNKEIGQPIISSKEYKKIVLMQNDYLAGSEMILIEGCIGPDPDFQINCRLLIERKNANIAAMQKQLYFSSCTLSKQELTIIYTPNLLIPGYPNGRMIAVDTENGVTRIMGSDYFGESKKGGLRMWNQYVFDAGGLGLHAGCKVYPDIHGEEKLVLIIGLSGTGKTTTTFRQQLGSLPVQDDFCALMPGGYVRATENGCFAKTYGLKKKNEPIIYNALKGSKAWLENVSINTDGKIDFNDGRYTTNGRGTFGLDQINHRKPINLPKLSAIVILNRNHNIIPAVVKLKPEQAAAYFMLGETTGTSAGGTSEAGKFLRIPGTNPFFCQHQYLQGNRFYDLIKSAPQIETYLLNTGYIGGENDSRAKKVQIKDSSAILEGIMKNSIIWTEDDEFGYFIADQFPGIDDEELLQPKKLYRKQNREVEYLKITNQIKKERVSFLHKHDGLYQRIIQAI